MRSQKGRRHNAQTFEKFCASRRIIKDTFLSDGRLTESLRKVAESLTETLGWLVTESNVRGVLKAEKWRAKESRKSPSRLSQVEELAKALWARQQEVLHTQSGILKAISLSSDIRVKVLDRLDAVEAEVARLKERIWALNGTSDP